MQWRRPLLARVLTLTILASAAGATASLAVPPGQALAPGVPLGRHEDSAEDREVLARRFEIFSAQTGGESTRLYDVLESVPGARLYRPMPAVPAGSGTVDAAAITTAREYAGRNRSNALLVWRDGRLEEETYFGGRDRSAAIIGRSLAKPLTAIAIGRALARGYLTSLDQPVAELIPEWKSDPRRARILVRHLLDMRSGLLPQGPPNGIDDVLNRAYLHPRHDAVLIQEYPVTDVPGSIYEYSNATAELVAIVIERATHMRYAAFISQQVFEPIGAMGGEIWLDRQGGTAHSGCCIMVPAETWLRLGVLLLNDGVWNGRRLLPRGYVEAMRTPTPQNPHYGLGVYVAGSYVERLGPFNPATVHDARGTLHSEPYLASDLFLFDGNAHQVVYVIPSQRMVIVRTGDAPPRTAEGGEWDNSFLPNTLIRGIVRDRGDSVPQPRSPDASGEGR